MRCLCRRAVWVMHDLLVLEDVPPTTSSMRSPSGPTTCCSEHGRQPSFDSKGNSLSAPKRPCHLAVGTCPRWRRPFGSASLGLKGPLICGCVSLGALGPRSACVALALSIPLTCLACLRAVGGESRPPWPSGLRTSEARRSRTPSVAAEQRAGTPTTGAVAPQPDPLVVSQRDLHVAAGASATGRVLWGGVSRRRLRSRPTRPPCAASASARRRGQGPRAGSGQLLWSQPRGRSIRLRAGLPPFGARG